MVISMKKHSITDLLLYVVSAELAGVLSALLSGGFGSFYAEYEKPPLLPPSWLFPAVWTVLYALMGISAYLIHISDAAESEKKHALKIYWTQLAVNFSWSIVFFRFELLWLAVAVIIVLLVLIIAMISSFKKICPAAAYMNIPYLLWTAFATYLTAAVALINNYSNT